MIAASPLSGCPLAKPATQILRWPSEGKGTTIGWAVGVLMNHWGVSSCCINPPVAMAHHRNDANTPRSTTESHPHPPKPPRPSGVTIVGPTTAIATHTTSQNHWAQAGRDTIGIWLCTRPRHRDGVDMPDAGLHPHREAMHKQHTEPGPSCCVCPSATHMSTT